MRTRPVVDIVGRAMLQAGHRAGARARATATRATATGWRRNRQPWSTPRTGGHRRILSPERQDWSALNELDFRPRGAFEIGEINHRAARQLQRARLGRELDVLRFEFGSPGGEIRRLPAD